MVPDITDAVVSWLDGYLSVPVATERPDPMPTAWVQLRVGSRLTPPVRMTTTVRVSAWEATPSAADDLAQAVRSVFATLAGQQLDGITIYRATEPADSVPRNDLLTGRPYVDLTIQLLVRADAAMWPVAPESPAAP